MVKEDVTKKWLVLLIVLVALSLVVDLLSLNVLYGFSGKNDLEGELAVTPYDACVLECAGDCMELTDRSWGQCKQDCKNIAVGNDCCYLGRLSYPYPDDCCNYYEKANGLC